MSITADRSESHLLVVTADDDYATAVADHIANNGSTATTFETT